MQSRSGSQQLTFTQNPKMAFFLLIVLWTVFTPILASPTGEAKLWEPVTWTFPNASCSGNPFDLVAKATFTHASSGQKIQTEFFYDDGDTWKLRFTS
ncbi:MAG: DUF5060 domain-containing protein [Planctomycetota bacterium]|jgi:hypothetical protein